MVTELTIEGMTCGHCQKSVEDALAKVEGVSTVDVDLGAGLARVKGSADSAVLVAAVEEEGYAASPKD